MPDAKRPENRYRDLEERPIDFAGRVLDVVAVLPRSLVGRHLGGQLLRYGTSPMANYAEAQAGESRKDFVDKLKIALKEPRETHAWLRLIQRRRVAGPEAKRSAIVGECNELVGVFVASDRTATGAAPKPADAPPA